MYLITITIPDVVMCIVARIYFTECYLYTKSFVNELKEMNVDDIINGDILLKYMEMNKKISQYCNLFYLWIMCLLLQLLMASWHTVSTYLHPQTAENNKIWAIYNCIETLIYVFMTIFILWPAMLMTEKINLLKKEIINEKLNKILKSRLHFHDDLILNNLMNAIIQKQHEYMDINNYGNYSPMKRAKSGGNKIIALNEEKKEIDEMKRNNQSIEESMSNTVTMSNGKEDDGYYGDDDLNVLWQSIRSHSKQECALEILNRLKYFLKKHSCCYELIGIEIDRSSIRDFIIALIITNILSFMWDSFGD